jgi:hypothetical protein
MSEPVTYAYLAHRNWGIGATTKRSVNRPASCDDEGQTDVMRPPRPTRARTAGIAIVSAIVLAACGGGESSSEPPGSTLPPPPDAVELDPAADTPANQLPDVVVNDVSAGNKVNLRNVAPADTPILLWMYAPH